MSNDWDRGPDHTDAMVQTAASFVVPEGIHIYRYVLVYHNDGHNDAIDNNNIIMK